MTSRFKALDRTDAHLKGALSVDGRRAYLITPDEPCPGVVKLECTPSPDAFFEEQEVAFDDEGYAQGLDVNGVPRTIRLLVKVASQEGLVTFPVACVHEKLLQHNEH